MASSNDDNTNERRSSEQLAEPKRNVALQGATMAFGKPPVKPKPTLNPINQNPALAAASKADRDSTSVSRSSSAQNTGMITDDDVADGFALSRTGRGFLGTGLDAGLVRSTLSDLTRDYTRPTQHPTKGSSESQIAATLAASRSVSTSPNRKSNTGLQGTFHDREAQHSPGSHGSHRSTENINRHVTDTSGKTLGSAPMSLTSSSINAFEQLTSTLLRTPDYLQTDRHVAAQAFPPSCTLTKSTLNPPTPQFRRPLSNSARDLLTPRPEPMQGNTLLSTLGSKHAVMVPSTTEGRSTRARKLARVNTDASLSSFDAKSVRSDQAINQPSLNSKTLQARTSLNNPKPMQKHVPNGLVSSPLIPESELERDKLMRGSMGIYIVNHMKKAHETPPRNAKDDEDASSDNSFVSASDGLSLDLARESTIVDPNHISLRQQPQRPLMPRMPRPKSTATPQTSMSVNSLADAMVASALASSRSQSPSKPMKKTAPAPPASRRSTALLFANTQAHSSQSSRTPSPTKSVLHKHHTGSKSAMRTTMRKTTRSSEDEDVAMVKRGRKNPMKKHPNKHHEGDRRRWRDVVSDRERKRYEGLWASNKGLFVGPTMPKNHQGILPLSSQSNSGTVSLNRGTLAYFRPPPGDCVSSLIVRDIWSRSRLPTDELSDIWELVDHNGTGMLGRDEFVAGVWLIDQRLKGRKLPQRVSESVWDSVGSLGGVKVKDKHAKVGGRNMRASDSKDLR